MNNVSKEMRGREEKRSEARSVNHGDLKERDAP